MMRSKIEVNFSRSADASLHALSHACMDCAVARSRRSGDSHVAGLIRKGRAYSTVGGLAARVAEHWPMAHEKGSGG